MKINFEILQPLYFQPSCIKIIIRLKTAGSRIACFTTKLLSRNYNPRYKKKSHRLPQKKKLENLPKDCTTKQRNQKKLLHTTKTNV